ncbi:phosphotransferase family protein [Chlorogloeopsis sp. ULAP02]|uniref:phosphotransferase family protein n=1 Tax=Chlorogloeopsis sp. ULAP02 TaxID=3107926 RepID=UPI0031370707
MFVSVSDPFNILKDPKLSFLASALDPQQVQQQFQTQLCYRFNRNQKLQLQAIRVIRYKPKRRCLIEYDVVIEQFGRIWHTTWIGKVRAKGLNPSTYQLQQILWENGFQSDSSDGISVPETIGIIPDWQMWLQRKVTGVTATTLLAPTEGLELCRRIAQAVHKLHRAWILPQRCHTINDELDILNDRLAKVTQQFPQWEQRLERVLARCDRLAATIAAPKFCGIHRDFYPDQILVDGSRLYLLDFDLYAGGDPALDIGNFNGHLIEQGLRTFGNPDALLAQQNALTDEFIQLSDKKFHHSIEVYTTLTLVRHIYLSTQFLNRQAFTEKILELCEQRLENSLLKFV